MKFSHGVWKWAEGIAPTCVTRVTEYKLDRNSLWVAAVDRNGPDPSNRFEGLVLQLNVTSPMADVIRVRIVHHRVNAGAAVKPPLDYSLSASHVKIEDLPDELTFTSGRLTLRICKSKWSMQFEDGSTIITGGAWASLGQMSDLAGGRWLMQRLRMGVGECLYGLGERFGPIAKNGQSISIWNEDGGTGSELAYKNIPFFISNRGYGLLVNSTGRVDFEIGTERVSQVQFSVAEEELDFYLFRGPGPKQVLEKYTRLSGRPALPPAWSFGLWLSTSFTTHYDEKTVNEFVDGMAKRGIPLSVFHFDCFWMKERHWCDFEWDAEAFPDPAGMLRRLKSKGLKVCVWINPYISQLSKLFGEGAESGYFLKTPDGRVFQRDAWQPGMALVDFTNPQAVEWYCGKLRGLLEMGVDCFKTDFGEWIPENVVYHDGSNPALMHNHYSYLYNKAAFELLENFHGKGNAIVFARSASIGCQKFPVHWGGDCDATWESMAEDLRGGLSFCASGAAFWSHDIGGFSGTANAALYKRWVAFGLLSTHSRLHGSSSYRVPWLFDEESVAVMRHFTRLKNRLFPYIYSASHDAHNHGWPVMRAMVLEFPDDPACAHLDRQYMLGSSLLVAPVFRPDNVAEYYVPEGRWTNFFSGEVIEGGRWRRESIDFMDVPLLVRENTVLPFGGDEEKPGWKLNDELTLQLFQIADGADVSVSVAASDGPHPVVFRCRRAGGKFVLSSDGRAKDVKVLLAPRRLVGEISNGKPSGSAGETPLIGWTDTAKPLTFSLKD
ncbi:MAG: alpha-xylosidase [Tepidisphaeraceae bacterium]|jgi:alpha-D-xyloside xylohydrolase